MNASTLPTLPSPFELAISEAQSSGNFKDFWQHFLQTRFEVGLSKIRSSHAEPLEFLLKATPKKEYASLQIAEDILTLDQHHQGAHCESLTGAEIISLIPEQLGIAVLLKSRMMNISPERVRALRKTQVSKPVSIRKEAASVPPAEPVTLAAPTKPVEPAKIELSLVSPATPKLPQVGDISSLKPRQVSVAELGLEMFIPGDWQTTHLNRRIKITDTEFGTLVDAHGRKNNGLNLTQWREMKLAELKQDYPQIQECSPVTTLNQGEWSGLIQACTQELQGRIGDDDFTSKIMLCCYCLDDMLVAIVIRAAEPVFEAQRPIYKWLSTQLSILPPVDLAVAETEEESGKFSLFSFSGKGRIGRIEFFIQSLLCWLPSFIAVFLCLSFNIPTAISAAIFIVLIMLSMLAPIVRRLHDIGLNGRWVWSGPILCGLAAVTGGGPTGFGVLFFVLNLVYLLAYLALFLVPGNKEANDYGPPPGKPGVIAKFCLIIALIVIAVGLKMQNKIYRDYVERSNPAGQQQPQIYPQSEDKSTQAN